MASNFHSPGSRSTEQTNLIDGKLEQNAVDKVFCASSYSPIFFIGFYRFIGVGKRFLRYDDFTICFGAPHKILRQLKYFLGHRNSALIQTLDDPAIPSIDQRL